MRAQPWPPKPAYPNRRGRRGALALARGVTRIGLIGAAHITPEAMIRPAAMRDDIEIVAVAARDPDRARAFADRYGIGAVEATYEALIGRDDIDLVYVATPPALHADHAIAALNAGKAVLCEKPLTTSPAEARAIVDAARQANRPMIEALHYRFHAAMRRVLEHVRQGDIGDVRSIEAVFHTRIERTPGELRWSAALGGGALMDLGCYAMHALRTVCGGEPTVVSADQQRIDGVDAWTSAKLSFPGGIAAALHCSMVSPRKAKTLRITGTAGVIDLSNFVVPHVGGELILDRAGVSVRRDFRGTPSTFEAQLDHVLAVMRGEAEPLTGGRDAIGNAVAMSNINNRLIDEDPQIRA